MNTAILRYTMAIVLLSHSVFTILDGTINNFANDYLNQVGFAPVGVPLAWCIKLAHVAAAVLFIINKWITPAAMITMVILVAGIIMVHYPEGWFVVGGGRNGMEYNVVLIAILLTFIFPNGFRKKNTRGYL